MKTTFISLLILFLLCNDFNMIAQSRGNIKLNIIVFGGHPDDADNKAGGTAALFAEMGHRVKFVSVTNGDAGHFELGGAALAEIRRKEAEEAGRQLKIAAYVVLDNHDGKLLPTLDIRDQIIREIRNWEADIVLTHRPVDYHPDHRYTGVLVQDAAYVVIVPNITPDTPPLKKNPVFLYLEDHFQKPTPFQPDIAVDITNTFDKKINALDAHKSQMYEWLPWTNNTLELVPENEDKRKEWLSNNRSGSITPGERESLKKWYGKEKGESVEYAESFEICEYGRQPSEEEIRKLFPMLNQ
ncbi:PIG-L deacetylase family protein [Gillisia sp. Q332]|uniref:PIG-L deacetylase family protein n=1 Tax=Gillisia xinjiangensis TaxID=3384765 RepID=UPI003918E052